MANSPLARRPYDLRHACLSTWLNAGVPPAEVAAWAGHGVDVLLRAFSKGIDGQEELAMRRIEARPRRPRSRVRPKICARIARGFPA